MNPGPSIHQRINTKATIEAWARYTVEDWRTAMDARKIGDTGLLRRSIRFDLLFKGQELVQIKFMFPNYGRFVDMGVGNGVSLDDVGELKISRRLEGKKTGNRRRRKPWLNKKLAYNKARLAEIMAEKYGRAVSLALVDNIVRIE